MVNRFNHYHRPIDWPLMLNQIKDSGIKYGQIAELTGRSRASITGIACDLQSHPAEWDAAFTIIDLWIRSHDGIKNLPVIK